MSERRKPYPFDEIEPRWQKTWDEQGAFRTPNPGEPNFDASKPKYYILDMFPYPSGAGLHVGHPEGYTATDIVARYKRMRGFNVLHPMGWDAFGLPAEQYAIKTGQHPAITTRENIAKFRTQLKRIGFSYDWDREISTADPKYFRWTQWIFLQIYNSWFNPETQKAEPITTYRGADRDSVRLAYVAEVPVNWCPELGTVLANEEVIDGKSEVGGYPVVRRPMRQWMLRITAFAERLIDELEGLDWPGGIKLLQRNWIGRSEGAEVDFAIADDKITVFTTRPDTIYGATYMVLAPEHPLVAEITSADQRAAVAAYREQIAMKSDLERTDLAKEKIGVFTGGYAINPVNEERIPIWIADYVLMGYGTGAIMAVPAHDERDLEFARKYRLPIRQVVKPEDGFVSRPSRVANPASAEAARAEAARAEARALSIEEGFFAPSGTTEVHERHLPHWQQEGAVYFLTWRLADSLPVKKLNKFREERDRWLAANPKPWSQHQEIEFDERFANRIDEWLDAGEGSCVLRDPAHSQIVVDALRFFDGQRYELHGYCVMPNHVHVLVRLFPSEVLPALLHSWKRHSAREINRSLGREGSLWQEEYYDRLVRSWEHWGNLFRYIERNAEKAGLSPEMVPTWLRGENAEDGFASRPSRVANPASAFTGEGIAINSPIIEGLPTAEAKTRITEWLEEHWHGKRAVNYKLRDWLFSRQRYWGEPFPILWRDGKHEALPESELPLEPPPLDDFKPTGTGEPPLARAKEWLRYSKAATRETNTMPQWAGSCWYYLRFCDPENDERFIDARAERYWMGGWIPPFPKKPAQWAQEIRNLYEYSRSHKGGGTRHRLAFGYVDDAQAKAIRDVTNVEANGMFHVIDSYALNHIVEGHGSAWTEEAREQLPISPEDFVRLPEVVLNPDRILDLEFTHQGLAVVGFAKRFNGVLHIVEEIRAGRNILAVLTMYKKKAASSADMVARSDTSETIRLKIKYHHHGKIRKPDLSLPDYASTEARKSVALGVSPSPGVDLYVGGTEHAVLHLLYARFWHKVLFDLGHVSTPEPFQRLVNQGMILGEDGRKMSKRWGNVIDPLDVIAEYGADAFRCYEMFMGPLEQMKPWSMKGVEGVSRFLARVWRLMMEESQTGEWILSPKLREVDPEKGQLKVLHATIKKVTEDIETLSFNTAISQMMILVNALTNAPVKPAPALRTLLVLLNPFAPHLTSELWEILQHRFGEPQGDITAQPWPTHEERFLVQDEVEIVIQVNGKVRDKIVVPLDAAEEDVKAMALASPRIQELVAGKSVRKVVVVPKKLVNLVVG